MKRFGLTCAVLASALGYSALAAAQDQVFVRDPRYGSGAGVRAGDIEIHPGIAAEFGYDSNYLLEADTPAHDGLPAEPRTDTFLLRLTPQLTAGTVGQQRRDAEGTASVAPKVTFQAGLAASYIHFIPAGNGSLEDPPLGATGTLRLNILPTNPINVDLLADFARTIQPSNNPDLDFDRFSARFGGGINWAPGGGMFDWRLGYEYSLTSFEDDRSLTGSGSAQDLSNHYNQINTRGRWRFLPRTSLLFDASATFNRYNRSLPGQLDSDPIRARIGLNGLVTSSFALLAMVGWGSSFYEGVNPQQFDGPIAQVELKWFITGNPDTNAANTANVSTLVVGYQRDFANSYLGDYYMLNRGYAALSYFLGSRFVTSLSGGVSAITYPSIYSRSNATRTLTDRNNFTSGFTTPWIDATLFAEYRPTDTIGINTTLRYSSAGEHVVLNIDELKWTRYEAYLGVRFFL
jgi:hypothetical protein